MDKRNKNNIGHNYISKLRDIGIFTAEEYLTYVLKKSERILAALYLVSDLLSDSEPLKWTLRERGAEMHALSFLMNTGDPTQKNNALRNLYLAITETVSYLRVGLLSGIISQMNFDLLDQELMSLVNTLHERAHAEREHHGYVLSQTFFDTTGVAEHVLSKYKNSLVKNYGHLNEQSTNIKDNKGVNIKDGSKDTIPSSKVNNDRVFSKDNINKDDIEIKSSRSLVSIVDTKKDNRRTLILDLLSKKSNLSIKDFSLVIKDCSEKTIQRELVELVDQGVLIRNGERRWSTYSLKNN